VQNIADNFYLLGKAQQRHG